MPPGFATPDRNSNLKKFSINSIIIITLFQLQAFQIHGVVGQHIANVLILVMGKGEENIVRDSVLGKTQAYVLVLIVLELKAEAELVDLVCFYECCYGWAGLIVICKY